MNPIYMDRAWAFTAAAIRYVGDMGAWREGTGDPDHGAVIEALADAHRADAGPGHGMHAAGALWIAAQFLLDLSEEIAEQEGAVR